MAGKPLMVKLKLCAVSGPALLTVPFSVVEAPTSIGEAEALKAEKLRSTFRATCEVTPAEAAEASFTEVELRASVELTASFWFDPEATVLLGAATDTVAVTVPSATVRMPAVLDPAVTFTSQESVVEIGRAHV